MHSFKAFAVVTLFSDTELHVVWTRSDLMAYENSPDGYNFEDTEVRTVLELVHFENVVCRT